MAENNMEKLLLIDLAEMKIEKEEGTGRSTANTRMTSSILVYQYPRPAPHHPPSGVTGSIFYLILKTIARKN